MIWSDDEYREVWRREQADRKERWTKEVRINPSASDLVRLTRAAEGQGLRGMLHDGDLYWWQAWFATHNDALNWMGIAGSKLAGGVEMHVFDDGEIGLTAFEDAVCEAALQHPTLLGQFDAEGNLKPQRKVPT